MTKPERDLDERVSLAGPDAAEVLKALLKVDPEDDPADEHRGDEDTRGQPEPGGVS
jgi:hypothetical protein